MKVLSIVFAAAFVVLMIAIPVALFFSPLPLLVSDWYVSHEYAKEAFHADQNLPTEERLANAKLTVGYLKHRHQLPGGIFTSPEVSHLRDVRVVTDAAFIALGSAVGFGIIAFFILFSHTFYRKKAFTALLRGAQVTLAFMIVIGTAFYLSWSFAFSAFHGIFFADGTWTFGSTAMLIRLFPEIFWQDAVLYYALVVVALSVVTIAIGSIGRRMVR